MSDFSSDGLNLSVDAILEGIGEGFFALDSRWRFIAFNRAAEELFGLKRNDVLGRTIWDVSPRIAGTRGPELSTYAELPVRPMGDTLTRYHVSLDVADKPGVLAPVAEAFARHGVSIQAVRQTSRGEDALLIIVTHEARDADLDATISELKALPVVRAVASVMRVEGEGDQ